MLILLSAFSLYLSVFGRVLNCNPVNCSKVNILLANLFISRKRQGDAFVNGFVSDRRSRFERPTIQR